MKKIIVLILLLLIGGGGCSTTPEIVLTDINFLRGVIYCEHSEIDEFTRHYYIKSEACQGYGGMAFQQAILTIPGVASVYPAAYKMTVAICPIYSWNDIEPEIISRINKLLEVYESSKMQDPPVDKSGGL